MYNRQNRSIVGGLSLVLRFGGLSLHLSENN